MIMMFWVCDTHIKPAVTDHLSGQKVGESKNSCDSELVPSCISSLSYGMLTGAKLVDARQAQCARKNAHKQRIKQANKQTNKNKYSQYVCVI